MSCTSCELSLYNGIHHYLGNDSAAIEFFRQHRVLPRRIDCPSCNSACTLREDTNIYRCRKILRQHRQRPKECGYSVSMYKNTFLDNCKLPPWKVLLYVNHFLTDLWSHKVIMENLNISLTTSIDWRSFCSEVCIHWLDNNQEQIGGPGISVEIDETVLVRRKYRRGRLIRTIWLFGGIERETKKTFLIPLSSECGEEERRNASTLIPLIIRHIRKESIIYSDSWGAYTSLANLGYTHFRVNHSRNFVDPTNSLVHTQTIERLWGTLKRTVIRPGIRPRFLKQYIARFQFIKATQPTAKRLHVFLLQAASLYPSP